MKTPESDLKEMAELLGSDCQLLEGKTILLPGGAGFLGTMFRMFCIYLNSHVLKVPVKVVSIDNYLTKGGKPIDEIEDDNIAYLPINLTKARLTLDQELFNFGINRLDFILNMSGCGSPPIYSQFPEETMDVSYIGTRNLLKLADDFKAKILNFSSSEVLGTPQDKDIPTSEEVIPSIHSMNIRAPYDTFKLGIETMSWVAKTKRNIDVKVVRLFNCVGYFSQNDYRVIPNYCSKLLKNEPIEVYAPGTQTRTMSFYTDVLVGCLKVLLHGKDLLYHVGKMDEEVSIIDLAHKMEKIAGKEGLVKLVPTPPTYKHEPQRRCPDITKISTELGYTPRVKLDDMLERIYCWAKENYSY
jgi:UDP-glucuronate decarboxylase